MGKQQTTVEIYNHEAAMCCIDTGFSASPTTQISVVSFPAICGDSAAHGWL